MGESRVPRKKAGAMGEHNGSTVALVLINSVVFAATVVLLHLWAFPQYAGELFKNEFRNLTLSYELPVTPSNWTVIMWPITLAWLLLCKVYTWILLCRRNQVGPAYKSPPIVGHYFLFAYTMGLFCLIAWTIVWDRNLAIPATVIIGVAALFCWLATAVLYKSVNFHGAWMARHSKVDLWLYRVFWHNGMAAFTTWLTICFIYMLGVTLRVVPGLSLETTVFVVLGSISGLMVLWFILENTVLDRFGRYTLTPYAVVIFWTVGVYDRQYQANVNNPQISYFIIALLAASVFCMVVRIGVVTVRAFKCPLYMNNKVGEDPVVSFNS